jgi:hypothetical protein
MSCCKLPYTAMECFKGLVWTNIVGLCKGFLGCELDVFVVIKDVALLYSKQTMGFFRLIYYY